jgi:hypothetical protein
MATWMTHCRIADYFLDRIEGISPREFIVGNIGPDCGEPNADWSVFSPPKAVSHWKDGKGDWRRQEFAAKYLDEAGNKESYSFYLGYYIHLLTDTQWKQRIFLPKKKLYAAQFAADKDFIWQFKRDWYDQDHLFHRDNPGFRTFSLFSTIQGFCNDYFDYYSQNAFQRQIDYISDFYTNFNGNLEHEYPYLNKQEMDSFVSVASDHIENELVLLNGF